MIFLDTRIADIEFLDHLDGEVALVPPQGISRYGQLDVVAPVIGGLSPKWCETESSSPKQEAAPAASKTHIACLLP